MTGGGGGGAVLTTRGQGYNIFPGQGFGSALSFSTNLAPFAAANTVYCFGVVLVDTLTVGAIVVAAGAGSSVGTTLDIGMYSKTGTLLVHTGALAVTGVSQAFGTFVVPSVVLAPDFYFYAWTSNVTTIFLNAYSALFNTGIINGTPPPNWGNSTTPSVGSVLPSSIALPLTGGNPNVPMANFFP